MSSHWKAFWNGLGATAVVVGVIAGTAFALSVYNDWRVARENRMRESWLRVHAPDAGVTCLQNGAVSTTMHCTVTHARFAAPVELTCDTDGCRTECR